MCPVSDTCLVVVVSVMEKQSECGDSVTEVEHGAVDWHLGQVEVNQLRGVNQAHVQTDNSF